MSIRGSILVINCCRGVLPSFWNDGLAEELMLDTSSKLLISTTGLGCKLDD